MTGFSIATISKALHDSPVVTAATKARVRKAAEQVGYMANQRGMSLRTGLTYQIAVLMPVTQAAGSVAQAYAHVDIDSDWAAEAATVRLIAGGHRRIALINPEPKFAYALDRIDGFSRAFAGV
jgi:DNA-binding LacI/PurR family transcriptional regulator